MTIEVPPPVVKKIPKYLKTYQKHIDDAFARGIALGFQDGLERGKQQEKANLAHSVKTLHMDALATLVKLGSVHGQLMEQINRAMQSEKDQL